MTTTTYEDWNNRTASARTREIRAWLHMLADIENGITNSQRSEIDRIARGRQYARRATGVLP